jgi:hypothetical protein
MGAVNARGMSAGLTGSGGVVAHAMRARAITAAETLFKSSFMNPLAWPGGRPSNAQYGVWTVFDNMFL